jgi:hypothetical protein
MNPRSLALLPFLAFPALATCAERKDLSPPPLNPHPKEAIHVTVSFDRPEDAKRYVITMKARYRNQQPECGYVEPNWNRRFIHPEGLFEIPNESSDPQHAKFSIYLDRYNSPTCNWELASPSFVVHDTSTGMQLTGRWGLREDLVPGRKYKAICPFRESEFAQGCYGRHPVPDTPFYNAVPASRRVPITVLVSKDSAPLRPRPPSFFSNFVEPITSNDAPPSP